MYCINIIIYVKESCITFKYYSNNKYIKIYSTYAPPSRTIWLLYIYLLKKYALHNIQFSKGTTAM